MKGITMRLALLAAALVIGTLGLNTPLLLISEQTEDVVTPAEAAIPHGSLASRPPRPGATRLAARQIFLAFPAEEHAPSQTRPAQPRTPSPRDAEVVAELVRLHGELNHRHFEGRLSRIPIELSGRMRSRLGELRLERRTGQAAAIGISRRHLKRDGWSGVRETLLHEMVHQWQAESGLPVDHRGEFRRKAREVGIVARAVRVD